MAIQQGDFTKLAKNYSQYRPSYSPTVLNALLELLPKSCHETDCLDIGAGTGIWTRMLAQKNFKSLIAIEPNNEMRKYGMALSKKYNIKWQSGSGENTNLPDSCCDLLTIASALHWCNLSKSLKEFNRILRQNGIFAALWNPRLLEANPFLLEIEQQLYQLAPHIKRVSSGRSGITENLKKILMESTYFDDPIYIEDTHSIRQTPEEYIGAWLSVNDIRSQAGEKIFMTFIDYIRKKLTEHKYTETTYLTRLWAARKKHDNLI